MQQEQQLISKKEAKHRNSSHNKILNLLKTEKKKCKKLQESQFLFCVKNDSGGNIKQYYVNNFCQIDEAYKKKKKFTL